jgi:hypothetical protein
MNFQEKLLESAAEIRTRATTLAAAAVGTARDRANVAARRARELQGSLSLLRSAGLQLGDVARRHVGRLVSENRAIAVDAGRDLTALARSTYSTLAGAMVTDPGTKVRAPRKKKTTRVRRATRKI